MNVFIIVNLIERLGKFVKKPCLYAKDYADFESFTATIETCLEQIKTVYKNALKSLLTLNFQTFPCG
ncbi:MAG TPA: hypothetical protein VM532_00500 [Burkholderiales bacterium]|nr:hypothetical protein [Burkholderiales bacterium]